MKNASDPKRYAHLKDAKGNWVTRKDAFIRFRNKQGVMAGGVSIGFTGYGSMKSRHHIGPELQIGHRLGDHLEEPVLLIKTAWGGRACTRISAPLPQAGKPGSTTKRCWPRSTKPSRTTARNSLPEGQKARMGRLRLVPGVERYV